MSYHGFHTDEEVQEALEEYKKSESDLKVIERRFTPGCLAVYKGRHFPGSAIYQYAKNSFKKKDWLAQPGFESTRFCFKNEKDFAFFIIKYMPLHTVKVHADGMWEFSYFPEELGE